MPKFVYPTFIIDIDGTKKTWPLPNDRPAKYEFNFPCAAALIYEADEVRKCIRAGRIESELVPHDESILIAHIQDEIRRQIGVTFPEYD